MSPVDKGGRITKEEPGLLWEDRHIAVLSKGAGWVVAISRDLAQNKYLSRLCKESGHTNVEDLVASGKCEHLAHFVILKFKNNVQFQLADSADHEFGIAHRLDVDTSGAILLGKTEEGFTHLRQSFIRHQIMKEYLCLVHGPVAKATDTIDSPILWDEDRNVSSISDSGLWAKSIYTVLGRYRLKGKSKIFTMCRVVIITGRTHQIRLHMSSIGHPLVSDAKYNPRHASTDFMWNPRLFLHAWRVGFLDKCGSWNEVKAPLPRDLTRALSNLEEIQIDPSNMDNPSCRVIPRRKISKENVPPPCSNGKLAHHAGGEGQPVVQEQTILPVSHPPPADAGYSPAWQLPQPGLVKAPEGVLTSLVPPPPPPLPGSQAASSNAPTAQALPPHTYPRGLPPPPDTAPPPPPPLPLPTQQPGAAVEALADQEVARSLVVMGFEYDAVVRALKVNQGDTTEALNMLSSGSRSHHVVSESVTLAAPFGKKAPEQIVVEHRQEVESTSATTDVAAPEATQQPADQRKGKRAKRKGRGNIEGVGLPDPSNKAQHPKEQCQTPAEPRVAAAVAEADGSEPSAPPTEDRQVSSATAVADAADAKASHPWARRKEAQTKLAAVSASKDEDEALKLALEQSQKDEEDRVRRQQDREKAALEMAMAESRKASRRWASSRDTESDQQFLQALEQSKRLEEQRLLEQRKEEEEFDKAVRESMETYERFHLAGSSKDLEETIRQSLLDSQQPAVSPTAYEEESLREAIQRSYNETFGCAWDEEDELLMLSGCEDLYDRLLERSATTGCLEAGLVGLGQDEAWPVVSGSSSSGVRRSSGAAPGPGEDELREWFLARCEELGVGFDPEILWLTLYEVPEDAFGDEGVLKEVFGLPSAEQLPHNMALLICELRQQKRLMSFGGS